MKTWQWFVLATAAQLALTVVFVIVTIRGRWSGEAT